MTDIERVARAWCECPGPFCPMIDGMDKRGIPSECADGARRVLAALRRPDSMEVRAAHLDRVYGPGWDVT